MFALVLGDEGLFPIASDADKKLTKTLLEKYRKAKLVINEFSDSDTIPPKLVEYKRLVNLIEMAHRLILDDEVKRIIEFRYLKGNTYKATILYFQSIMSDRTIDRKLDEGIESIANTVKLLEK